MAGQEDIRSLQNRITELEQENRQLHETVEYLTKKTFGRSSEKTSSLGIEGQMSLFDEAETETDQPGMEDVASYRRKKNPGHKEELLKDLLHEKKLCTLDERDRFCERCGTALHSVGEEFVRTEIEFIPARVKVIDYYRETFECRTCRKKNFPTWKNLRCQIRTVNIPNIWMSSCRGTQSYRKHVDRNTDL